MMIKMKGAGAVVMTFDKFDFRPRNGILEIPDHLERHAIAQGFRRLTAAELEELRTAEGGEPATAAADLPADHPQAEAQARADAKLDETITERATTNPAVAAGARALAEAGA